MKVATSAIALLTLAGSAIAIPAFPGAEGLGKDAVGGRAGTHYLVTNLNDSGAGSLRDAVSQAGRIVTFAVGGTINIDSRIVVAARVTILGQTAPGDGIATYGNGWSFSNAHNAIVRYIRIRMGKPGDSGKDAITIADGDVMIFDHVSVTWGRDETFSISGTATKITVQDSIIGQGLETHSCGGLMETDGGISLFRNLYIDNKTRNPKVKGVNDFTNNVVYNWGGGGGYIAGDSDGQSRANIIHNYFISGPSTSVTAFTRGNANFQGYVKDNYYDSNKNGVLDGTILGPAASNYGGMVIVSTKFDYPGPANLLTAPNALTHVLANAGCSKVRDAVDKRLIQEVQSWGTSGQLISDEKASPMSYNPSALNGGTRWVDTDGDGIPDDAEIRMGTDPNKHDSMLDKDGNGYLNIEDWANSLIGGGTNPTTTTTSRTPTTTSRTTTAATTTLTTSRTTTTTSRTTTPGTTAAPTGGQQPQWGQCGGIGWTGPTACASPATTCSLINPYYAQCL